MSDSVSVNASTIQELLQTIKMLQSDMVELKSGGYGANNPPTQTDPTGLATLPNGVEMMAGLCVRKNLHPLHNLVKFFFFACTVHSINRN